MSTRKGPNHNWHGERHSAESVARAMAGHWAEFYGLYTPLKPGGSQLCGPCPLHKGEGPNFKVDPATGRWYCHSQCGRGGDVFQFLEQYHQTSFADAVLSLARWAGLPVPDPPTLDAFKSCPAPPRETPPAPDFESPDPDLEAREAYFQSDAYLHPPRPRPALNGPGGAAPSEAEAADCHDTLLADREVLAWLRAHRGLTRETLERFEVGLTQPEPGKDLCWPRVTFPVRDRAGRLTNLRKHLFAFDPDLNRARYGKTLPWAAGLPADLFPLSVLWGPSDPTPAASADPSLESGAFAPGKGGWRGGSPVGSEGFPVTDGSRPEEPTPFDTPLPPREGSLLAAGVGSPASGVGSASLVLLTDHLLLVEGESDALLANQMGIPALTGTLGAGGWRPQNTRDLAGLARVTILYDADDAGRKGARARARDLAGTVPDIRLATLPPGLGTDLTDWVLHGGGTPEGLRAIIAAAERAGDPPPSPHPRPLPHGMGEGSQIRNGLSCSPLPPIKPPLAGEGLGVGADGPGRPISKPLADRTVDLADVPPPPGELPYLWGAYLNEGASHWLTGKTGLGKSTFAFNLACALAEGRTLWGVPCTARRLLYVDLESGDLGRSLKIQRLYGDRPRQAGRLRFVREPLRLPDESAELVAYAEGEGFDLVIFDTARRVFAVRDENDNAEVYNRVIPTLDALKSRGIATLTMGHPPKNGGLGARGAGAQEDAGDVNLLLTMHRGEVSDADGVLALTITKNRLLGLGTPPLYLRRIGHDQFERLDSLDVPPAEDSPEKLSPRDRCRAAVVTLLETNQGQPVAYKEVMNGLEAQGYAKTTIHRAMKELMDKGEVEQPASGHYVLSDPFA